MLIKTIQLPLLLIILICFSLSITQTKVANAQETMQWEMQPNESLIELAAMFYPKSAAMQRVFIAKTQQLNQETQMYADANARYPTSTQIVIPTLKSLSVRGTGVKKSKRSSKMSKQLILDEQELTGKKQALDSAIAEKNAHLKVLEDKVNQLKQQLDTLSQITINNQSAGGAPQS